MQINFDARLAASTVLVDGREWCQGTLTNLATNPGFEATGSTVEVARNRIPNPRAVSTGSTVPWTPVNGTATWETGSGLSDGLPDTFRRIVATTSSAGWYGIVTGLVSSGETVTLRRLVRVSRACTVRLGLQGAGMPTPIYSPYIPIPAGEWTWVTFTLTLPTLVSGQSVHLICYAYDLQVGDVVDQTAASIDQHTTYLDGSYSPDPDLIPSWVGAVDNSASVLTAPAPAGFVQQSGRYCIQSVAWSVSGTKSLRVTRTGTAEQAAAGAVVWTPTSGDVGKTFTAAVWCRPQDGYDGSQDVILGDRASRGLYVFLNAGVYRIQAEPVGEAQLLRMTFTIQAGQTLRVGGGGTMGQTIRYDDFTIVEGEHPDLVPFHGSTVNPEWPGVIYAWAGTPNASTSTRTTPVIDRIEVDRDPGTGWVPVRGGRREVINGFVALTDHEMPLHQEVRYRVAGYSGSTYVGAFTGTVDTTIPGGCGVYVKVPGDPNATVCAEPTHSIDIESPTQGGVYDIAGGSSVAVAAWSGRAANRFTLSLLTKQNQDALRMRSALQQRVLLFQGPEWQPFPAGWYYVESVREGLRGDGAIREGRKWELSLVATGIPSGDSAGVAGASYVAVRASYPLYEDLPAGTYFDILQGA